MGERLARMWALDLRALAAVRICYGVILLCDIFIRATDLVAHYTDWGLAPRAAVLDLNTNDGFISFHMMNGTWPFEALLFTIGALACISLTVGYHTRLSGWIAWIHLISMQSRNGMVLDGGDIYIRCVMFWLLFLPWGARWSIDAVRGGVAAQEGPDLPSDPPEEAAPGGQIFNIATFAYMLQIALVYFMAFMLKTGDEWTKSYLATYYALKIEQLTTPLAPYLLPHMELMKWLTMGVVRFEEFGPLLLFLPGPIRLLGVLGIMALHLGFGAFMHLAIFVPIGVSSPMAMIPSFVWNRFERTALFRALERQGRRVAQAWPFPGRGPVRPRQLSAALTAIVFFLLLQVIAWNITDIPMHKIPWNRGVTEDILTPFRLDQKWNMFAPRPLDEDGWYVIEATEVNGQKVDLFRDGAPVVWVKPARIAPMYPNARWRKFMMNIWSRDLSGWRLYYGRYLTRKWNTTHVGGAQVSTFTIYFMLRKTLPNGTSAPVEKIALWNHRCFDNGKPGETPKPLPPSPPRTSPTPALTGTPIQISPAAGNSTLARPGPTGPTPLSAVPHPADSGRASLPVH